MRTEQELIELTIDLLDKEDYLAVIDLLTDEVLENCKSAVLYLIKGTSLSKKKKHDKSIRYFKAALEINNQYIAAYNNIGVSFLNVGNYKEAIKYLKNAVTLDKNFSLPYRNLGRAYEALNNHRLAFQNYNLAINSTPPDYLASNLKSNLIEKLGIRQKLSDLKTKTGLHKIFENVNILDEEEQNTIITFYVKNIETIVNKIRECATSVDVFLNDNHHYAFTAHYTSLKTADVIIMNVNSKLRYSNAVFMNDPQEGEMLIDCIDSLERKDRDFTKGHSDSGKIKSAFNNVIKQEQSNFYLGSFLPVTDIDQHEDELLMWRTYGRDENQKEAAGCCMVIDKSFFDFIDQGYILPNENENVRTPQQLYKVLYYDQRNGIFHKNETLHDYVVDLKNCLLKLLKMKKKEVNKHAKNYNNAIDKVLYHSLSELRYFFKSADFAYENELRVIQYATNKDVVKIDDQSNTLPRRVYIDSSKPLLPYLKEIVLGPMVPHPERWMYLQKIMTDKGHDFKLRHSNCRFQ